MGEQEIGPKAPPIIFMGRADRVGCVSHAGMFAPRRGGLCREAAAVVQGRRSGLAAVISMS